MFVVFSPVHPLSDSIQSGYHEAVFLFLSVRAQAFAGFAFYDWLQTNPLAPLIHVRVFVFYFHEFVATVYRKLFFADTVPSRFDATEWLFDVVKDCFVMLPFL